MLSQIVSQVRQDKSSFLGLFHCRTVDFDVVGGAIYVYLLLRVVDDVGGWQDLAVSSVEVEQGQKVVHVGSRQEIWDSQGTVEPARDRDVGVSSNGLAARSQGLLHLHEDTVRMRIEVKEQRLLHETVLSMDFGGYLIETRVNGLLQVQSVAMDLRDVPLDVL